MALASAGVVPSVAWGPRVAAGAAGLHRSVRGMVLSVRDRGGAESHNGGVPRAAEEREKKKKTERREGEMYK